MAITMPALTDLDHFLIYGLVAVGIVLAMLLGRFVGRRDQASGEVVLKDWARIVDGPILAIYGLLLAFSFNGAMQRFDERRKLIVDESIVLASAFRQTDLLGESERQTVQQLLREYAQTQSELREQGIEGKESENLHLKSRRIFEQLWDAVVAATSKPEARESGRAMLPTLNKVDEIGATSSTSPYLHPPLIIHGVLALLSLVSAFLLGYQSVAIRRSSWVHLGLFVIFFAVITYLIVDLEYPRLGAIRIGDMQEFLRERHRTMEF